MREGQRGRQGAISGSTTVCRLTTGYVFSRQFCLCVGSLKHTKTDTAGVDLLHDLATAPRATTNKTTQARSRRGSYVGTMICTGQLLASRGTLFYVSLFFSCYFKGKHFEIMIKCIESTIAINSHWLASGLRDRNACVLICYSCCDGTRPPDNRNFPLHYNLITHNRRHSLPGGKD